jgi:exodeoxyribonuclease-3
MNAQRADLVCLQEIKATEDVIPAECREAKGWHAHFHPAVKPGYSGVAIYSRHKPDKVHVGMQWPEVDAEGRYLQVDLGKLSVISLYLPSGTSGELRQTFKYRFLDRLEAHLQDLRRRRREYVICGDFNIAHKEIDLKNWRGNQKNSGFLPDERAWLTRLFDHHGYVDAFRAVNQEADQYTWWSNRGQARAKNVGWRIDYHVVSPRMKDRVRAASIYRDERFSDHAPLTIDYEYEL